MKLIAEIGWNHMGDMDLAKKMIEAAASSGANYCKFQTWSEKKLVSGSWDDDGRREIYKKAELSESQHYGLKEYCEKKNTKFLTTIFPFTAINLANSPTWIVEGTSISLLITSVGASNLCFESCENDPSRLL